MIASREEECRLDLGSSSGQGEGEETQMTVLCAKKGEEVQTNR